MKKTMHLLNIKYAIPKSITITIALIKSQA